VFEKFLDDITRNDSELRRYLQRIAGYALTGEIREQKLFFLYGPGNNGKTVFVNAIAKCAGDYAKTATMEVFVEKRGERHTTDLAMLAGARLVTASETKEGRKWDEALIKRVTGGDAITCRFLYHDNFTYTPSFTLIILGNYAPELKSVNEANRRRLVIIPFTFRPANDKEDKKLEEKLREEYPAILAWMIRGARDWYERGLGDTPKVVLDETADYFEEQHRIKAWVDEYCYVGPNYSDASANLFQSYVAWCKRNHTEPVSQNALTRTLRADHGCDRDRAGGTGARRITGIAVKVYSVPDQRTGEREDD
jgi:putative DNA primase/helicase